MTSHVCYDILFHSWGVGTR